MKEKMRMLLIILFPISLSAGDATIIGTDNIQSYIQGYTLDSYHSIGFSNIIASLSYNISAGNPASISNFTDNQAGFSFKYATDIDNVILNRFEYGRAYQYIPYSFGFILPSDYNLNIGFGFHQKYSHSWDWEIPMTTVLDEDGLSGKTFTLEFDMFIYSLSGLVSYNITSPFDEEHKISFGAQIYLDYLRKVESMFRVTGELNAWALSFKLGLKYDFNENISLGLVYDRGSVFTGSMDYNSGLQYAISDPVTSREDYLSRSSSDDMRLELPDKLAFGFFVNPCEQFSFSSTISNVFWNDVDDNLKNQFDISAGIITSLSENVKASAGILFTDLRSKYRSVYFSETKNDAIFLSGGMLFEFTNYNLQFIVSDSHLFSADTRKQTNLTLGCEFNL